MLHCKYVILIKITHFIISFPFTEFIYVAFTLRYSILSFYMLINDDVSKPIKLIERHLNGPNLWN